MARAPDVDPAEDYELSPRQTALTEARVGLAYECLVNGFSKSDTKKVLRHKFGLGKVAIEEIITAARKRRAAELIGDPESARDEIVTFVDSVRQSPAEKTRDKLRAAELQIKMLGLAAPTEHAVKVSVSLDDVVRDIERRRRGEVLDVEPLPALPVPAIDELPPPIATPARPAPPPRPVAKPAVPPKPVSEWTDDDLVDDF